MAELLLSLAAWLFGWVSVDVDDDWQDDPLFVDD